MKIFVKLVGLCLVLASTYTLATNPTTSTQSAAKLDSTPPPPNGALSIEQTPPITMETMKEKTDGQNQADKEEIRETNAANQANQELIANEQNADLDTNSSSESAMVASGQSEELDAEVVGSTSPTMDMVSADSVTFADEPIPA